MIPADIRLRVPLEEMLNIERRPPATAGVRSSMPRHRIFGDIESRVTPRGCKMLRQGWSGLHPMPRRAGHRMST